jgi:hypothetical protein
MDEKKLRSLVSRLLNELQILREHLEDSRPVRAYQVLESAQDIAKQIDQILDAPSVKQS